MNKILKHVLQNQYSEPGLDGNNSGIGNAGRGNQNKPDITDERTERAYTAGIEHIYSWNPSTVSGGGNNGGVTEAMESLQLMLDGQINPPFEVKLMPVEMAQLLTAAVVLYTRFAGTVYYYVLVLESTTKPLTMIDTSYDRGRGRDRDRTGTKFPMTTDCLFNVEMITDIETMLVGKLGLTQIGTKGKGKDKSPIYALFGLGQIIVNKSVDLKARDQLGPYFDSAIYGLQGAILMNNDAASTKRTASDLVNSNKELTTTYSVQPGSTFPDRFKGVIAGDITVVQTLQQNRRQRGGRETADWRNDIHGRGAEVISAMVGYIDMRRNGDAMPIVTRGRGAAIVPGYDPVFVITSVNILGIDNSAYNTLMSTLLGMTLAVPFMEAKHKRWASLFDPGLTDSNNLPSLGVLGLEYDPTLPQKIVPEIVQISPSNASGNSDGITVHEFVNSYFTDNVVICIDKQRGGPNEFFLDIISRATAGSDYESVIIAELDAFTDGNFGERWLKRDEDIVIARTAIFAGHFNDPNSNTLDIRTVNYLRMLERTDGDQNVFDPFAKGLEPGSDTMEDMAEKYHLLSEVAPGLTITGVHDRMFINPNFLTDILKALEDCDVTSVVEGLRDLANGGSRRDYNATWFTKMEQTNTFGVGRRGGGGSARYDEGETRSVFKRRSR